MKTYRSRNPRKSPIWQCVQRHHATFVERYPGDYESKFGPLRPVISEVFEKFLQCGTLERGFARVRCDHCAHEYLHAFSCKGRWFCPSCHQRKVLRTAAHRVDHVLLPVPHRHVVLALPKLLRPIFYRHRGLLKRLCTVAQQTITQLLRAALQLTQGRPAFFLALHTFFPNPFSSAKVTLEHPCDTVIYRSRPNPKINRNFEVFDPVDFLAVLSQHIPDKGAQMIRYQFPHPQPVAPKNTKTAPGKALIARTDGAR